MYQPKAYFAPECEILTMQSADVLTLSNASVCNVNDMTIHSADEWFIS